MSTWNHRIVRYIDDHDPTCILFEVSEVYYNKAGLPVGWAKASLLAESKEELSTMVDRINAALGKPVLWADRDFTATFDEDI